MQQELRLLDLGFLRAIIVRMRMEYARIPVEKIFSHMDVGKSIVAQPDENMTSDDFMEGVVVDFVDIILHGKGCLFDFMNR